MLCASDLTLVRQVRRIDGQLDRLQLASSVTVSSTARAGRLQSIAKSLSAGAAQPVQRAAKVFAAVEQFQWHLQEVGLWQSDAPNTRAAGAEHVDDYEQELEWLVISKAATQTYGLILETCLGQIISVDDDIWYWNGVLASYRWSSYYTLQTAPLRFWAWGTGVYAEAKQRLRELTASDMHVAEVSVQAQWRQFYGLVRQTVRDRGALDLQSKVMSPVTRSRNEAERKQKALGKLRELGASGLGVLIDEALRFEADDAGSDAASKNGGGAPADEWRSIVAKSIVLMETALHYVTRIDTTVTEFEDGVFSRLELEFTGHSDHADRARLPELAEVLRVTLADHLPRHQHTVRALRRQYGRPSRAVRYWFPTALLLLSSTTLLRLFLNHRASAVQWARSVIDTTADFWFNWVVQPTKKIIGTIRHDEGSEIAIMSKRSLEGDRASLERMVTEFALDHPDNSSGKLSPQDTADIRAKVREGDLTPVLKAYERDLRRPVMGTLRGDLIRALLIQIQKTKVDVEVAMGGIDSLLKSQELVFGFVGLGPGLAVCFALYQWLFRSSGGRGGRSVSKSQLRMIRVLA